MTSSQVEPSLEPDPVPPEQLPARAKTRIEELAQLRAYAEDVLVTVTKLDVEPGTDELRLELIRKAQAAVRLVDSPVTIGVVGEFSAGKSLLLGTLVGTPDLLPVKDDPTTANVTALHLVPRTDGGKQARISNANVEYLTLTDLSDCLRHMLDELAKNAADAGVADQDLAALRTLAPQRELWPAVTAWCRDIGWPKSDLRLLIAELMRLRDTVTNATAFLGWATGVEEAVFRGALMLPTPEPDPTTFPRPQIALVDLSERPQRLSAEQLRATLSLVKRVTFTVQVPPEIWDLSELRDHNELVLLDFPGLDSTISGVRDHYLSRRELEDVTTILVVLNAQAGGRKGPTEFPKMMQRAPEELQDSVLVVVGRFDQLPDFIRPDLYEGGPTTGDKLTERRLLEQVLGTLISNARLLVGPQHDERILFHSAMVAIDTLDQRDPGVTHYDDTFRTYRKLSEHVPKAKEKAQLWGKIAARLAIEAPGSTLGPALEAFSEDGGVRRIRERLEHHAKEHGLRLRLGVLHKHVDDLEIRRLLLVEELRNRQPALGGAQGSERRRVEELLESIRKKLVYVENLAGKELRDPRAMSARRGLTLSQVVEQQAVDTVFSWPQWNQLFEAVEDGEIATRDSDPDSVLSFLANLPDLAPQALPLSTDEFGDQFTAACTDCERYAVERAWEALGDWIRRVDIQFAQIRDAWKTAIDTEAQERVQAQFGAKGYLWYLTAATDLTWLVEALQQSPGDPAVASANGAAAFPLREGAGFAWDPAAPDTVQASGVTTMARHQMRPARLRRELVNGVADAALDRLGALQNRIADKVVCTVKQLRQRLPKKDALPGFVDAVVGSTGTVDGATLKPATGLEGIIRPPLNGSED